MTNTKWTPFALRPHVDTMTAKQLFEELVEDATRYEATPLMRFEAAIVRIAKLQRKEVDAVMKDWFDAVKQRQGGSAAVLPMA